jgi:hypothetical protein
MFDVNPLTHTLRLRELESNFAMECRNKIGRTKRTKLDSPLRTVSLVRTRGVGAVLRFVLTYRGAWRGPDMIGSRTQARRGSPDCAQSVAVAGDP